ncbi:hypothetical protein HNQ91_001673 [Filimonas zeae]|uniref:MoxR-vWA-beta-propeller ternary system domain-containing protein n=1 Tax=Filimonas zeae TaxID=1737353 RepID=A0A917J0R7_9BACT|nr:hypothetical protein [Filimonas zeae]MDR6338622.1 hypothetical protein [Filimonas zeae]GGH67356.1 hypothetical protein GCM10011379_22540 [Filimonas zeae]
MAKDVTAELVYVLEISRQHQHYLGRIRHWEQLMVACNNHCCLVKGFTKEQAVSTEVKSIPFATLYHWHNGHLFRPGGLVPEKQLAAKEQFQPIAQALPVTLPAFNHNYFGIQQQIPVRLVPGVQEQSACGMLVKVDVLGRYIATAAAVRLQPLQWCLLNRHKALVLGTPLLPLSHAQVLWQSGNLLLPVGYTLEWPVLSPILQQIAEGKGNLALWQQDQTLLPLFWQQFRPLSVSSFRLTTGNIAAPENSPADGQ